MVRGAEILVLSTHQPQVILDWCSRVIRMDQGRVVDDGPAEEVMRRYLGQGALEAALQLASQTVSEAAI